MEEGYIGMGGGRGMLQVQMHVRWLDGCERLQEA